MTSTAQIKKKGEVSIKWKIAAELPASNGQSKSLGFAGPINGVNNNVLVVAGGANFPDGLPWEGGKNIILMKFLFYKKQEKNLFGIKK